MERGWAPFLWIAVGGGVVLLLGRAGAPPAAPARPLLPAAVAPQPAESLSRTFREVARRVRPSVLSITTIRSIRPRDNPIASILEGYFGASERVERSFGTGFVVRPDGLALTSHHVVAGVRRVVVRLHDGREVRARVIGTDPLADLAVLQLDPPPEGTTWPAVTLGDSSALEPGDWVLAVGNPFGFEQTVTAGIVSAKGRSQVGIAAYEDFIQTDVAINPGNSGGPLLALDGRVVGLATAIATRSGGYQGIGFAIPIDMARGIMDQIVHNGHVVRGWLGVSMQDASPQLAERLGQGARAGALVSAVLPGGPAEAAGVAVGDLVVALAGEAVGDAARLMNLVGRLAVGKPTTLRVVREGKELELTVVPSERKLPQEQTEAPPPAPRGVGVTARMLDPSLCEAFDYAPGSQGVVIVRVEPGSLAAEHGLRPGMILQEVNRQPIRSLEDLNRALEQLDLQQGVLLRVWDGTAANFVLVQGAPE
jgi:serine protease Do